MGLLMPWVAWRIKRESPGPVFFKQLRVGENGRRFRCYKFRTMHLNAEARKAELMAKNQMAGPMFKLADDPRVFPYGGFLRRTSLDELPQFLNVLRGDMSVVGTRPPTPEEVSAYETEYRRRLSIKPGVTGLWQVSGRSDITDFQEVLALDLHYIDRWSLALDMKIILKTLWVVLFGRGAY
jgi:lipopolysaccharide/colanic/teichoic acid biosynthesis glycosyltransferase